ncbi:MAG: 3-oxoacyl-ACP reductase FabG [Chloroflexi bacterium]|nr:3-oxoacyl-ACP reductase FabG [Chloroflexota bacterium]
MEFTGKLALVTGGGRGIGAAVVDQLSAEGCDVIINDVSADVARAVAARVEGRGRRVAISTADVTDADAVAEMMSMVSREFGRLDILVNNVGGSGGAPTKIEEITLEHWERAMALNLRSVFLCTKAAIPLMRASGGGRIVNLGSIAGQARSVIGGCQYAAAKAGVLGFTRHLAADLAPYGITLNAVAPGTTASERVAAVIAGKSESERTRVLNSIPLGRMARPDEVAAAVVFLCSPQAGYITGATIDVNGGAHPR